MEVIMGSSSNIKNESENIHPRPVSVNFVLLCTNNLLQSKGRKLRPYLQQIPQKKEIAEIVGVHISTIYREIHRNGRPRSYDWKSAQRKCDLRKQRLHRRRTYTADMRSFVHEKIREYWSPKQIVGYMKRKGMLCVSHETIYQEIREDKCANGELWTYTRHKLKHRVRALYFDIFVLVT